MALWSNHRCHSSRLSPTAQKYSYRNDKGYKYRIKFLNKTEGSLTPSQLIKREMTINDLIYNPSQTVDSVFNKIQHFQDLCGIIRHKRTDTQLDTYVNDLVLQQTWMFMESLKDGIPKFRPSKRFLTSEHLWKNNNLIYTKSVVWQ